MNLTEMKAKPINELVDIAESLGIEDVGRLKKQEIIFRIFKQQAKEGVDIYGGGVLEILNDGFGFLRSPEGSYCSGPDDIYVSPSQVRKFSLRKGDEIHGKIRPPKDSERYFALVYVDTINKEAPEKTKKKIPDETIKLLQVQKDITVKQLIKFPNLYYAKSSYPLEISQRAYDFLWRMCESYELWCKETNRAISKAKLVLPILGLAARIIKSEGHQGLSFTGFHLSYFPLMQNNPTN